MRVNRWSFVFICLNQALWPDAQAQLRFGKGSPKRKKGFDHSLVHFDARGNEPSYGRTPFFVAPVNPFRLNRRMVAQKGVFLMPGTLRKPFMANLLAMQGVDKKRNVLRIDLPREVWKNARSELQDMNISRASLFPGLDGFAQSLGSNLRLSHPED